MATPLRSLWVHFGGVWPYVMQIVGHGAWPRLESWTTILAGFAKPILKLEDNGDRGVKTALTASRLLNLPPELRNRIYELVLVEPEEIQVHQQNIIKPPALLASCKQIRSEALKIYFASNTFNIWAQDCNGRLFLSWRRHFSDYIRDAQDKMIPLGVAFVGRPDWSNLVQWLKAEFHESHDMSFEPDSIFDNHVHTIYHRTNLVVIRAKRAGRSWVELERDLEDFHVMIAACESTWT